MADSLLVPWSGHRVLNNDGEPQSGALVYIYLANTSTLPVIYSDVDLLLTQTNPVTCDSGGIVPVIYIGTADYKIKITTAAGATIYEQDDLPGALAVSTLTSAFSLVKTTVQTIATNDTLTTDDLGNMVLGNSTAGSITLTLPSAVSAGNGKGILVKHNGSANNVVVAPAGGQTIDGSASSRTLSNRYAFLELVSDGANWFIKQQTAIPAGTKMLFQQTSAPTGWTKDTTHNDKALRVVSGTASSGGSSAFSTVFGKSQTDSHTLSLTETPAHTHGVSVTGATISGAGGVAGATIGGFIAYSQQTTVTESSVGGGAGHTHGMDIRVQYVDLIIATKD